MHSQPVDFVKYVGNLGATTVSRLIEVNDFSSRTIAHPSLIQRGKIALPEVIPGKGVMGLTGEAILKFPEYENPQDEIIAEQVDSKYFSKAARILQNLRVVPKKSDIYYYFMTSELNMNANNKKSLAFYDAIGGRLNKIEWQGRIFELKYDIHISIRYDDGLWFHEYEDLGIYAFGETVIESLSNFYLQFDAAWKYYGEEEDERLTLDAQQLKEKLHTLVSSISKEG